MTKKGATISLTAPSSIDYESPGSGCQDGAYPSNWGEILFAEGGLEGSTEGGLWADRGRLVPDTGRLLIPLKHHTHSLT